jgi:thiamine biosynthesis lipoprotein
MMVGRRAVLVVTLAALAAWAPPVRGGGATAAAADPDHEIRRQAKVMGTVVGITIWGDDEERAARAIAAAFDELRRIDALMTTWTDDSEVSRINAAAGSRRGVAVSAELFAVLEHAVAASRASGGAFDITVGVYQGLWKFDEDRDGTIPSPEAVAARVKLVGWRHIALDRRARTVRLTRPGMRITLGGIAKGYGVDRAVAILHREGFTNFIIQAGGDLFASGRKGDRAWRVGIRDPRGDRATPFALTEIEDMTFSTSGDYERFVIKDGVRYHHILDPKTGRPATLCRSVTIMARDAITADGWSKAVFVLGPDKGMKLIERLPDVEAVIVDQDNQIHVSSGLKGKLTILQPPTPGL